MWSLESTEMIKISRLWKIYFIESGWVCMIWWLSIYGWTDWLIKWSLREKCPNTEFFLVSIFLYSVRIQENTDQKKLRIWTLFTHWICTHFGKIRSQLWIPCMIFRKCIVDRYFAKIKVLKLWLTNELITKVQCKYWDKFNTFQVQPEGYWSIHF